MMPLSARRKRDHAADGPRPWCFGGPLAANGSTARTIGESWASRITWAGRVASRLVSTLLIGVAVVIAVLCVPTIAGLTAMGLTGGDGEPENLPLGVLGALVGYGSIYNAVTSFAAFWELPGWRWWLMLVPPAAGLLGLLLSADPAEEESPWARLGGLALQLVLGVPVLLVLATGAVAL